MASNLLALQAGSIFRPDPLAPTTTITGLVTGTPVVVSLEGTSYPRNEWAVSGDSEAIIHEETGHHITFTPAEPGLYTVELQGFTSSSRLLATYLISMQIDDTVVAGDVGEIVIA